ncbi:hypothetical protein D9619_012925 [Psilocybe cf. subviscida]|uniref:N-acetyltransferase domain-containing protein n=1 Tax=Psilocybe cf. subviscida TaxID=2480587 RepID=A0A8H5BIB7_9AGAR|nr:hypothetical protein D9619_012925 [Psilocybe cf. subviscida]
MYTTQRLMLRGYRPGNSDKDFILDLFQNHNVLVNLTEEYITPNYHTNSDRLEAMIKCALFVVVEEKKGTSGQYLVGFALVDIKKPQHLDGHMGMALSEEHWGKGYGTEILEWLKPFSFKTLGLRRLSLHVYSSNKAAIALYKKTGFEVEGCIREALWKEGEWVDVIWMGILSRDYYASIDADRLTGSDPLS